MQILIADDEPGIRNTLSEFLKQGHDVLTCSNGEEALGILEKSAVDLVITDQMMPKVTGLELIPRIKKEFPNTAVILMTAHGSVEQAVQAIQLGAEDYLMKPVEFSELEHRIRKLEEIRSWRVERSLKIEQGPGVQRMIGQSAAVARAKEFVGKVADVHSPVLILGPSGSGKEVLAKAIHESGNRADHPFIAINCASLSEQLMESELFGHEKGAFTGATASKPGKFELAKGGTLFLDEIGELSLGIQAKLLRVLQEKEFYRVGGVRQIKTDARVIAATHRPLKQMVEKGAFREDLFFRLNVLTYELPPLSKRGEDIPALLDFFWSRISRDLGRKTLLSPEAREQLLQYPFPGNIRELQNVLERLIVLGPPSGEIGIDALPQEILNFQALPLTTDSVSSADGVSADTGLNQILDSVEKDLIQKAMTSTGDNQVKAAEKLKITRGALQYKLKKHGLTQ